MSVAQANAVDLNKLLTKAQLPALPHSAIKVMELSRDDSRGPADFAIPIEADPGLTGQVLRFVNSSYFGFSNEISNVRQAITLVGIRTIKNFVLWSAIFSLMPNPRCGPFELKRLWQDSLRRALFARMTGHLLGIKEAEEAFSAGLLQDMAVPLLAKLLPADYVELLKERDGGRRRLSDLEQHRFGWTHAQAAGVMARQWKLPADFATLIEGHLKNDVPTGAGDLKSLATVVSLSALLPSSADEVWSEQVQFEAILSKLTLADNPTTLELLAKVDEEFEQFAPLLKLTMPARALTEYYRADDEASA